MEGIALAPGSPLAEYAAAHDGVILSRVEGVLRAEIPDGRGGVNLTHGYTEGELLAKLTAGR